MSKSVGKSVVRVDAYEKATGRAKYTDDLCERGALVVRLVHATVAHGMGRKTLNSRHQDVPPSVSVPLGPAQGETAVWEPWFLVDMCCDRPDFYLLSGTRR